MINITNAKKISGWMNEEELKFLAHIARKSQVIIEVGSYYGRSCRALADNTDGIVYAIDPYKGEYQTMNPYIRLDFDDETLDVFNYNLSDHLRNGKVIHFRGVLSDFVPNDYKLADLVFIDGDHSYEGCLEDIKNAVMLCKQGAIIAGHDYGTPGFQGVDKAVKQMFGEDYKVIETIWYHEVHNPYVINHD